MRVWPLLLVFLAACGSTPPAPTVKTPPGRKIVRRSIPKVTKTAIPADKALLERLSQKDVVIIDVRSAEEFFNGHLKGAKNIDFLREDFEKSVNKLDRTKRYYLYCASGNRSGKARRYLLARGVKADTLAPYETLKNQGAPVEGLSP